MLWRTLLIANVIALLGVAVWLRAARLESVPGVNGDEAWIGVQAQLWLRGEAITWRTPTRNPINPFFFFPQALGHALFQPSFAVLRAPAVVSGLLALLMNLLWAWRVFGRTTAVCSTLLLAVLPLNIAYSRFAWDASQSLLASLVVLYLTIECVRAGQRRVLHLLAVGLALVAAVLVHPTNIFLAPIPAIACAWLWREELKRISLRCWQWRNGVPAVIGGLLTCGVVYAVAGRWIGVAVGRLLNPAAAPQFVFNCGRLLSGTTVYQFIAGSHTAAASTVVDLIVCGCIAAALFSLWRRAKRERETAHLLIMAGWTVSMTGFFLIAGPEAMAPHFERYSIWLIGPTCLLLTISIVPALTRGDARGRAAQLVALSVAWCLLLDFHSSCFGRFAATGGDSHATFRTGRVEPKLAAFERVLDSSPSRCPARPIWIITSEWWNYWPIRYLATAEQEIRVESWSDASRCSNFRDALAAGRVWCVEFTGSEAHCRIKQTLSAEGLEFTEQTIADSAGRPILSLIKVQERPNGLLQLSRRSRTRQSSEAEV
jgi:4-amino-4-deoxy-L-arabinose transferase-like glycosyltransferase